jgi:Domain of unknown function (DUF4136)
MTRKLMRVFPGLVVLGLTLCSNRALAASVQSDYDKSFDFSKFHTFAFKDQNRRPSDPLRTDNLTARRMQDAIAGNLIRHGFQEAPTRRPDFLVAFYRVSKERMEIYDLDYGLPRGWRWRGFWGPDIETHYFVEGTMVVDVIDSQTNNLVWRGYSTDTVNIKKMDKQIDSGIEKLINEFAKDVQKSEKR